jgi:hypothetical protein
MPVEAAAEGIQQMQGLVVLVVVAMVELVLADRMEPQILEAAAEVLALVAPVGLAAPV